MNIWQVSLPGYPHSQAFDMVALCLRDSIRDLGYSSEIVYIPQPGIVLGAHLISEIPPGSIIYNLEQITPQSCFITREYLNMLRNHRVWDYSKRNITELKNLGIDAVHMPIGYHPVLENVPKDYLKQISCLFYGSGSPRRDKIIQSVQGTFIFGIYGKELEKCIASSEIILNCHYYDTQLFEIVRCSYLMANKKFILSEPGLDTELEAPFKEGIAFHKKEEWPEVVKTYLANPDIREKIAQKGFEIFSQMKQTEYLKNESESW